MSISPLYADDIEGRQDDTTYSDKHPVTPSSYFPQCAEAANAIADVLPHLPKGCKPLTHQVAGHRYGQGKLKLGMLQHADGSIMKPLQPPPRGDCELRFYESVFHPSCQDPVLLTLRPFLPRYLGICHPSSTSGSDDSMITGYLKLEDACRRFHNPSILDVKIGKVCYDPHADAEKIAFESGKYPPLKNLGFQLLGARVSGQSPNEAVFYDKKWGRSLTEETVTDGLELFLSGNKACKKHIIKAFLERLETILIWFESQNQLQFYASSLLLVYEGEFFDGSSDSDEEFMHKYRSILPSLKVNKYLDAIDKVLQTNIMQDVAECTLLGKSDSACEREEEKPGDVLESKAQEISEESTISSQIETKVSNSTSFSLKRNGIESGYSSEVDSKIINLGDSRVKQDFVDSITQRMRQHAIAQYTKYRFPPNLVDVRMIDFTHVFQEKSKDENYIFGLKNLIAHMRHMLKHS